MALAGRALAARERRERLAAVARDLDRGAVRLEHAREREDVAHIVLDDENAAALERSCPDCAPPCSICCWEAGSFDSTWCRNSVTSSSSRSGERASLMMMDLE